MHDQNQMIGEEAATHAQKTSTSHLPSQHARPIPALARSPGRSSVSSPTDRGAVGRVYEDVKNRILSGDLRLRERLDIDHLARTYRVSGTPVRQALSHLAFERLIVPHPTRGFRVALWSEKGLRALYDWRGMLACLAAETCGRITPPKEINGASTYADVAVSLFQSLHASSNIELARAAINADERLRAARVVEPDLLPECDAELTRLTQALVEGRLEHVQIALRAYHQLRVELASEIRARALLRALPDEEE
jgi:Bacterial regulatory proteins, gntR family